MTPKPDPNTAAPLAFDHVSFSYGAEKAVEDVTFEVSAGEFVAIAGPNGGGKSTLLKIALGLVAPDSGRASILGSSPDELEQRWRVGFVPQRPFTPADFPATVREVVAAGRWPLLGTFGVPRMRDRQAVAQTLERVGIGGLARRRIGELSGGQQQRVHLARALAAGPELLLLDEPMAGVDAGAQIRFRDLLAALREDLGVTVVLVAHEYGPLEDLVERLIILARTVRFDGLPPKHERPGHEHHGLEAEHLSLWSESSAGEAP